MRDDYGITETECSYWVRIGWTIVDGKKRPWYQTTFTYSKYPTKAEALLDAREWRDEALHQWDGVAKKLNLRRTLPFKTGTPQKNNKTGVIGVFITDYLMMKRGRLTHVRECIGFIRVNKISYEKSWSCHKYGDDEAIRMATEWRKEKEEFFTKRPNVRMIKMGKQ